MRTKQRRYHDADRLEELAEKLLSGGDENEDVLKFLLCLENPKNSPTKHRYNSAERKAPKREEIKKLAKLKGPLYAGDYPHHLYHTTYTLYPSWYFLNDSLDQPLMYPDKNTNAEQDFLYAKPYAALKSSVPKHKGSLYGLQSDIFGYKGLTGSTYEFDSQTRLYGGLRHSRTSTLDITLSYPEISGPIDMLASIKSTMTSIDEGFVSPSSSIEFSDSDQELSPRKTPPSGEIRGVLPYHGFRFPAYDLNLWKDCLTAKKSFHRTWETLGLPAGSTHCRLYLTEAGSKIFDEIWQHRTNVIYKLTNFLNAGNLLPLTWCKAEETKLVKHAVLVMMGVTSDTFQFNSLGQMFLPYKDIFFSGVDREAVHSVMSQFGEWGTCYWRLLHFSASSLSTPQTTQESFLPFHTQVSTEEKTKGVIFKAFAGAIRRYLHEYQHQLLAMNTEHLTLQELAFRLRRAGAQIRYICQLSKCGTPDMPSTSSVGAEDFPVGVALLSYLYEEAVHCPEPNHYLALLYLLRKSCLPYLQFVQDWVFRGKCWDAQGEFMLRVNADYGGARKDRQRWLKYVEPVNPEDPGSCVPSFLSAMANEIYCCGKTVALMQLICPEHFLGINGLDTPNLEITFSKRKLKMIENNWQRHENLMIQMEKERTVHWMKKEEDIKTSANEIAKLVRKAAKEEIKRARKVMQEEREKKNEVKRIEFERLKKQAEDDANRRALALKNEREEDIQREAELYKMETRKQQHENKLLQEEKAKMMSYYEELNMQAELRLRRATWATERRRLHSERMKHLSRQRMVWENEIRTMEAPARLIESLSESHSKTAYDDVDKTSQVGFEAGASGQVFEGVNDFLSCAPMDEILQDFVNVTISSQQRELTQPRKKQESDTEKAFKTIGGSSTTDTEFVIRASSQDELIPKPHVAPGVHHVSEETHDATTQKPHSKMVPGKGASVSHVCQHMTSEPGFSMTSSPENMKVFRTSASEVFGLENSETGAEIPGLSTVSSRTVGGKNISDSDIRDIMGVQSTQGLTVVPPKPGRKTVQGHFVTDTSLSVTSERAVPHIRILQDKKVSDSSITEMMAGTGPNDRSARSLKKPVRGQCVSASSMGELLADNASSDRPFRSNRKVEGFGVSDSSVGMLLNPELAQENPVFVEVNVPNPAKSTMKDLIYGSTIPSQDQIHRKKKISGQDVSESTVGHLLKQSHEGGEDNNGLRRFAVNDRLHGGHHSRSTIQDLMYYEDSGPQDWGKEQSPAVAKQMTVMGLKPAINSSRRHPSYSTLQLLLYPQEVQEEGEIKPIEKFFHLQLPPMDGYCDVLQASIANRNLGVDLQAMDPIGNVVGNSLEYEFEDEVLSESGVDWRSDIDAVDMHALPVLLSQCVVQPIMQQAALANRCVVNHFMADLELPRHFEMLRHFCFMEDGEFGQILSVQLFEKIHSGCRPIEILNPIVLGSLITQAVQGSAQRNSPHADKLTFAVQNLPTVFSTNDPSSLDCFILRYDIGWPCNIVVTETNEKKYGQVFGFLLKLKHIMWALHDVMTKLAKIGTDSTSFSQTEIRQLHLFRHEMHNFVKVMQGYVSTQVVHVCWHEFQDSLKSAKCLEDLHLLHVEYLRKCVFRCLLTKKTTVVMNVITDVFKTILRFWTQLSSKSVTFVQLKHTYNNFKRFSTFLFKVVAKLVERGYQPHLEDLLVRLNFNGFYNE